MIRHGARGVPWLLIVVIGALLIALLQVVARWPYTMWPLEGCAVGLLAGGAAWCFDEPAAAVVDTAPRHLAWRTAARSLGVAVLVGLFLIAVILARHGLFGHSRDVAVQGVAAAVAATAYATWRRAGGVATPGRRIAGGGWSPRPPFSPWPARRAGPCPCSLTRRLRIGPRAPRCGWRSLHWPPSCSRAS